ncbi:MAG: serine/threonine-protein phosphatase [Lachnospiraceae bacterium]|nr:serine/threonine-protein phosphatase [Lachnospiraceae bacterium]
MGRMPEYFVGCLWEKGKKEKNQDSLAFWWMNKNFHHCLLGVICDGIGGLSEGENASTYAVKQLVAWFLSEGYYEKNLRLLEKRIQQLLYQLHFEIKEYGREKRITLGTTISLFLVRDRQLLWVHFGDSRIYLLKKSKLIQLTRDHKENNGALNKALGTGEWALPDMGRIKLGNKDRILVCSDGFYRGLEMEEIRTLLKRNVRENETAERMLKLIYQKKCAMGERDDISAIFLGFREE